MKKIVIVLVLLLVLIVIGIFWWQNGNLPADIANKNSQIFIIKNGESVREIANNLKTKGLIKDPVIFFLLTKQRSLDKQIQAGDFRLNPSMTALDVATALTHGTLDIWITIPEGQRAGEIADTLKQNIPNYNETWRTTLDQNEGYLFPDTYLIPRDADIDIVINLLRNTFETKYQEVDTSNNRFTKNEIVTIASMVEREARHAEDRSLVASVIVNRLNLGMKLDIDATIQYALGYQKDEKKWWKRSLTAQDLKLNSPYNTYANAGLPPTPISNPGIESLKAAANPKDTDYLFYMTDANGINHYSKDLEGHNSNIQKYKTE